MVHAMFLFYIGLMATISACKNVEWLHKKWLIVQDWWYGRTQVYLGPVV